MPSAPTPTSEILRVEVNWPVICMLGSSDVGLSHSNVRPLGGSPVVMQLKVTSVPRSTISTLPKEATEASEGGGDGRGSDLFSNKQCSYHQLLHEINRGWTLQGWHHEPTTPFWPSSWILARPGPTPPPPLTVSVMWHSPTT